MLLFIQKERNNIMNKVTLKNLTELNKIEEREFIINLNELNNSDKKAALYFLAGLTFYEGTLKKLKVDEFSVKCN